MKKIIAAVSLLICAGVVSFASDVKYAIDKQLQEAVAKTVLAQPSPNKGAIDENITMEFDLYGGDLVVGRTQVNGEYKEDDLIENPYPSFSIKCKAYALDEHWAILAGTCPEAINTGLQNEWSDDPNSMTVFAVGTYMGRKEKFLGFFLDYGLKEDIKNRMDHNDHVMLVWNEEATFSGPFVKVLATQNPNRLFALSDTHTFKINSASLGLNAVRTRTLKTGSVKNGTLELQESFADLSGTYTDPLFAINSRGNEFITGYNQAVQFVNVHSSSWYTLTERDLHFIKNTVQANRPQDWARIKNRLFFNQTQKPFFK
ncbi:hypothetical protein [Candidatus Avelusimicrobium luingense]|uniref:hypothetical protein n=1 Tax=Candidatus Avelusimicrobium luingense TaxID=3416211 RepID=UPI003D0FB311